MKVLHIDSNDLKELTDIADFSQLAINLSSIDKIRPESKTNSILAVLKKIRTNGELVISTTNCNKILDNLCKNNIDTELGLLLLKRVEHYTDPMELVNFIVSLEPNIVLYKLIEDNFETILTLKKVNY
jgi:hypothetical protein